MRLALESRSAAMTRRLGKKIGGFLAAGDVVSLDGELGAGKTTLAKGIAEGLGVNAARVVSPTFVLVNEYIGRTRIYHIDWYRLDRVEGCDRDLALECFGSDAVTLIEWPARGRDLLPDGVLAVKIQHTAAGRGGVTRRHLSLFARSSGRFAPLLASLKETKRR